MQLADLLTIERIRIPLESDSKDELLRELVSVVTEGDGIGDRDVVLQAVRDREAILSTGIGHGVAIPHGKSAAVSELRMAAGLTAA
ncbi:MAG: PTS sugar transporter subunit IIA, partial [Gemmatimonadota bacterium]